MQGIKLLLGDKVLIKPDHVDSVTKGGIIIPEGSKKKSKIGTVVFAGEGKEQEPLTVKEGNRVLYESHATTDMNVEGVDYYVIAEDNIIAIL